MLCEQFHCGHIKDSAVGTPVFEFTPVAFLHSFSVVALVSKLSEKSAPSITAPSKRALTRLALVKSATRQGRIREGLANCES